METILMPDKQGTGKRVLVTGASRGIGRAVAAALAGRGYQVLGTSRNPDRVTDRVEGILYLRLDLSDEGSIADCAGKAGPVDILINNAGQSQIGPAEELPQEKVREHFQVNVFGALHLAQLLLPGMRERGKGVIINIGSLAGRFALPFQSAYSASKFALAGFSWSLRNELRDFGIKVVLVEPNHYNTEIMPDFTLKKRSAYRGAVRKVIEARTRHMSKAPGPEEVADKIVKILRKNNPKPFYVVGGMGPAMVFLKRFFPDRFIEMLIRRSCGLR